VVYDLTFRFCARFLSKGDRTIDQMVQAARSGKQNIVEGSKAAGTSKEMEIKLTNVARASLEELLEDYRDFLRVRDLEIWAKDSSEAHYVRKLAPCGLRDLSPVRGDPPGPSGGQHSALPDPPDQLPAGSADKITGTGFFEGRRPAREDDQSEIAVAGGKIIGPMGPRGLISPIRPISPG